MPTDDPAGRPSLLDTFGTKPDDPAPPSVAPSAGALMMPPQRMGAIKCEIKRDEREVLQNIKQRAASAGEHWFYRFPVKSKKTGKTDYVEGVTIKCANDIARLYGNCEVDTRVIDLGDAWLIMARFTDYETGFGMTRPYQQRKSQRFMGDDAARAQDAAFSTGVSKAIRNVVCNSLQSIADFAFEEATNSLVKRIGTDVAGWRDRTVKKLEPKIDIRRVEAVMGRPAAQWLATDVAEVIAVMTAIQDGMRTWDEAFPPLGKPVEEESGESKVEQFAKDDGGK